MGEEVYNNQSTIKILFDDSDQITLVGLAIFLIQYFSCPTIMSFLF